MRRCTLALFLLTLATATVRADPITIAHAGYLLDGSDAVVDGSVNFTFALHADPSGADAALWTSAVTPVNVRRGYYEVLLGGAATGVLGSEVFAAHSHLWLAVAPGGVVLAPRVRVGAVPLALRALAADAVTNGVYTTGSYADPAWLTSIAGTKVTGSVSSADSVANGVYTTGAYADPSWLTSLAGSKVTGTVPAASSVTNGVYTTGSYADPTWITSLGASKLTGAVPASQGGTGLTSPGTGSVLVTNGAGSMTTVAPGAAGNVLVSNGSSWSSASPATGAGGTGADGALTIASGTVTLDVGGVANFTRHYTSLSITGTGRLVFTNPNAKGTEVTLFVQGNATVTCTSAPCIDLSGLGAAGGATVSAAGTKAWSVVTGDDVVGKGGGSATFPCGSTAGGVAGAIASDSPFYPVTTTFCAARNICLAPAGSGGGAGGKPSTAADGWGAGGRGGGGLYVQIGGALDFTGSIWARGVAGSNATCGAANANGGGGGGGGAGGSVALLYRTLVSQAGAVDVSGGTGGGVSCGSASSNVSGGGGGGGGGSLNGAGTTGGGSTCFQGGGGGGTGAAGKSVIAPLP